LAGDPALARLNARRPGRGATGGTTRGAAVPGLPLVAAIGVAVVVIANAWSGLMPGVGFWDTGEFQTVLPIMGTAHPTGYPTYVLLGFVLNLLLTPIGEPAFRINVISLLAVAGAAALTVELVRRLTGSVALGVAAGLGLALTPFVWQNATRADPHPVHLFFVALLFVLLIGWEQARRGARAGDFSTLGTSDAGGGRDRTGNPDRWLVAAAVVFALAAGNHSLTLLLGPPIALFVLAVDPRVIRQPRLIATCAIALVATLAIVYLELPLRAGILRAPLVYAQPDTWDGFWYIALAEQFRGSLSHPLDDLVGKTADLWALAQTQFGILAVVIPFGFLAAIRRFPRYALLSGTAMVITVVFNAAYSNADINRYYLGPILWAWTWIAAFGLVVVDAAVAAWSLVTRRRPGGLSALGAPAVAVAVAVVLLLPAAASLDSRRRDADRHGATEAQHWLDSVLPTIAPNAVVVSWWSTSTPLWYSEFIDARRTDIFVIDDRTILDRNYGSANGAIAQFLGSRPVYVIRALPQDLAGVRASYALTLVAGSPSSNVAVYQVVGRAGTG
jgi:transmembrane protein TMEM260 (protein O-mannosyltransferase)